MCTTVPLISALCEALYHAAMCALTLVLDFAVVTLVVCRSHALIF